MDWLSHIASRLLESLLGPGCVACGLPCRGRPGFCPHCLADLGSAPAVLSLPGLAVHAAFGYTPALARRLIDYKFHEDLAAGRALAAACVPTLAGAPRPEALLPVPLHHGRLRQRGHDQAHGLARDWGCALDLPVHAVGLHRLRSTRPQTTLPAVARRHNVQGAFRAAPGLPGHVALVDDVCTTAATALAAAAALRQAGVARVELWVVARVTRRGPC